MDWDVMTPMGSFYWLGEVVNDIYEPAEDCIDVLDNIIQDLLYESAGTFNIRRRILVEKTLENDLIPLLKDCRNPVAFDKILRILVTLSQPAQATPSPNAEFINTQLTTLITSVKQLSTDVGVFKALGQNLKALLSQDELAKPAIDAVNLHVLFMRNLFHLLPSAPPNSQSAILHQCLISSFFMNELDHLILSLLIHKNKESWTVGLTQLLSFMFKTYSSSLLEQDTDDLPFSNAPSRNTSPIQSDSTPSSNQNLTGDFDDKLQLQSRCGDSESSEEDYTLEFSTTENGKLEIRLTSCLMRKTGSRTSEEESLSKSGSDRTSGNGDFMDVGESDAKGSSLPQTSSGSKASSKDLQETGGSHGSLNEVEEELIASNLHPTSTLMDLDILVSYLKKFATSIMDSRFVNLVENIMTCLLTEYSEILDHSFLMWTVGFFLSFAQQQDIDIHCFKDVLNLDLFGYLVYEGVFCCENFRSKQKSSSDCSIEIHRLYLVMCTLNQMFRALVANKTVDGLNEIYLNLGRVSQLPDLFVLLVSSFMESKQTLAYLRDVVQTNHLMVLMMEEWMSLDSISKLDLFEHVKKFATKDIMGKYGNLLDTPEIQCDGLMVSVLTMMYHVAGNCGRQDTLIQPNIMMAFYNMWADKAMKDCEEFRDLVEFMMELFMSSVENDPLSVLNMMNSIESPIIDEDKEMVSESDADTTLEDLSEEEKNLAFSCIPGAPGENLVNRIIRTLCQHGFQQTPDKVAKFLSLHGFETEMSANDQIDDKTGLFLQLSTVAEDQVIPFLVRWLKNKGFEAQICWLQKQLLEMAYVKLTLQDSSRRTHPEEPIQKFFAIQNKAVPLVPWNPVLSKALNEPAFQLLIFQLGLTPQDDDAGLYSRIPPNMTFPVLVNAAQLLGPIENLPVKFDLSAKCQISDFENSGEEMNAFGGGRDGILGNSHLIQKRNPAENGSMDSKQWLNFIQQKNLCKEMT